MYYDEVRHEQEQDAREDMDQQVKLFEELLSMEHGQLTKVEWERWNELTETVDMEMYDSWREWEENGKYESVY